MKFKVTLKTIIMKKHHLILLTSVIFLLLFYDEYLGLNFGLLGWVYAALTAFTTPVKNRNRTFFAVLITTVISSLAFMWYGDDASFFAAVCSLALLSFRARNRSLKSTFVIPVFMVSFLTFIFRIFQTHSWLPKSAASRTLQQALGFFVIPAAFITVFFLVYAQGSTHFAALLTHYRWNFDFLQFFGLLFAGFFIAFNYWNHWIPVFLIRNNHILDNDFSADENAPRFSNVMNSKTRRLSAVVTLAALSALLLIFLLTFNYEQFYESPKPAGKLSVETHERVNAVIVSILMAVGVVLFYFKSRLNFTQDGRTVKVLAKIWLALNAVLVLSTLTKNSEYVLNYGLTYKRLGVYAFLMLCLIALTVSFIKIQHKKTNAFLLNHMVWYLYFCNR